jgi:hypothetical protein
MRDVIVPPPPSGLGRFDVRLLKCCGVNAIVLPGILLRGSHECLALEFESGDVLVGRSWNRNPPNERREWRKTESDDQRKHYR